METRSLIPHALACFCLLLGAASAAAQSRSDASPAEPLEALSDRLQPGDRIRLVTAGSKLTGTLVSVNEAAVTLRIHADAAAIAVPVEQVLRLDLSRGTRSAAGRGALIGGGVGAATGLILGIVEMSGNASGGIEAVGNLSAGEVALVAVLTGALGAGVGAIIGSLSSKDRWESVPLSTDPRTP